MYRVMIVEDELLVRMGLKNSIDWSRFDMQIVADAADGMAAYDLYEKVKPDLIITDLNMPVMSGMELISKIRERDKAVKIVILTCLEEFELARKAVSLGVSDYIVKHMMTEDHIGDILSRVACELAAGKAGSTPSGLSAANAEIIKEKLIKDLILYDRYSPEVFASLAEKLNIRLDESKVILCVMEISHYGKIRSPIVRDSILSMLGDIVSFYNVDKFVQEDDTKYILILGYRQETPDQAMLDQVLEMLKETEASVKGLLNTAVSFGLSGIERKYSRLYSMYEQAVAALGDAFFGGAGVYGQAIPFDREGAKHEKTEEMLKLCEKTADRSIGLFAEYFARIRLIIADESRSRTDCTAQFSKLIQWAAGMVKIPGESNGQATASAMAAIEAIRQSETLEEILRCLYDFFTQISAAIRKKKITSREIKQAVDFVEASYAGDLSLPQVADMVGLSPNYFSSLFKKETDASFTEYLTEVRIEKAKEMLLETYLKTYEIAESVGFKENAYFCKTFKKVTGKTPGEFRRQWLKRWREEPDDEALRRQ